MIPVSTAAAVDRSHLKLVVLVAAYSLLSTLLGRGFTAFSPGTHDAQLFAYMGQKWLEGSLPYLDLWDNKTPGIFAVIAGVFAVFPYSFASLAAAEVVFTGGCVLSVYALMRKFGASIGATALATLACSVGVNLTFYASHGVLTEIFLLWPAVLSMLMFARGFPGIQIRWMALAGFFAGCASLFKQPGLAPALAQGGFLALCWVTKRYPFTRILGSACALGMGIFLAWLPFLIYFGWQGGLAEFLNATLLHPLRYGKASQPAVSMVISGLVGNLVPVGGLVIASGFGLAGALATQGIRGIAAARGGSQAPESLYHWIPLVFLWLLADLAGALAGGRNYEHYYLAIIPSLCVAAGFSYWYFFERQDATGRNTRIYKTAMIGFIMMPLLWYQGADAKDMVRILKSYPDNLLEDPAYRGARYLNSIRGEEDTLYVWDYMPGLYFYTGMNSPSRFTTSVNLKDFGGARDAMGAEILTDLRERSPTFIVNREKEPRGDYKRRAIYEDFLSIVFERYELIHSDGDLRIYKLASSKGPEFRNGS